MNIIRYLSLICLPILLVGCLFRPPGPPPEPMVFGVPQSQWQTLTRDQQNEVIRGYNQRQQQAEANAPFIAAVNALDTYSKQTIEARREHW